jgi:putative ABC transport system permease protein
MRQSIKLAFRNLIGAGLRTWLNVSVLSFSFVVILFYNGLIDGWNKQARRDTINWETAHGHVTHQDYDAYDPFSLLDGHGDIAAINNKHLSPILIQQGSIYPDGRIIATLVKGIDPEQEILELPSYKLDTVCEEIPILIGNSMVRSTGLKKGDVTLLQWKDQDGTYDATSVVVADVFKTTVPTVDMGQIYMSIDQLWKITGLKNHASFLVADEEYKHTEIAGWKFKNQDELLTTLDNVIATERASGSIFYILLMLIALLAIFDTQVLSIFRRQKEIGTYMALGMTRTQVVKLFTVEGSMYSIFAMIVGSIYGIPLLQWLATKGIPYPVENIEDFGISISDTMYPVFGAKLILGTILVVVVAATIVSYLPARKISKMNAVDAIKGKLQ